MMSYTAESLKSLKNEELSAIALSMGIEYVGEGRNRRATKASENATVPQRWGRKNDLIAAILVMAPAPVAEKIEAAPVEERVAEVAIAAHREMVAIADLAVGGVSDYVMASVTVGGDLARAITQMAIDASQGTGINPTTLAAKRSQVFKKLESLRPSDRGEQWGEVYRAVANLVRHVAFDATKESSAQKAAIGAQRLSQRADDVASIRVAPLVAWAMDTLKNLPEISQGSRNPMWRDVAIAIAVATGRRASEIMSSGKFELGSEPGVVLFYGHLKRHSDAPAAPYQIPVIGGQAMCHAVIDGLRWLDMAGKRVTPESYAIATGYDGDPRDVENIQSAAAESHKRCSRYLSERVKQIFDDYVILESGPLVDPNASPKSKKADRRTMHMMRQIYAQLLPSLLPGSGQKLRRQISKFLGHSEGSSAMAAAAAYDADIFVVDGNVAIMAA